MSWRTIIGYVITAIVSPLSGYFAGKYIGAEMGAVVGGGVAGVGSRVLHLQDPPAPKAP